MRNTIIKGLLAGAAVFAAFGGVNMQAAAEETPVPAVIEDGTYWLNCASDAGMRLDIPNGAVAEGTNVEIWSGNDSNAQKFYFAQQENGSYVITAECSGKALTAQAPESGANAALENCNGSVSQQWTVLKTPNDTYKLKSVSADIYLDVFGGFMEEGNNVQVWENSGSAAQEFYLEKTEAPQTLGNGLFVLASALDEDKRLDIYRGAYGNGTNVELWAGNVSNAQKFAVEYAGDGTYTLTSLSTDMRLDVNGGSDEEGTNIQQWSANDSSAQRFKIQSVGNGYYTLQAECSGLYVDINGADAENGVNIQQWSANDSGSQYFKFYETEYEQEIANGTYAFHSSVDGDYYMDIAQGSEEEGVNTQIWDGNNSNAQKFQITYLGNGEYKITCVCSGLALDVDNGKTENGTAVRQWEYNGTDAQRWRIYHAEDGSYYFQSVVSGNMLDVNWAAGYNGNTVQSWEFTGSAAQRFWLNKTTPRYTGWTTINGRKYYYNSNGELSSSIGIDVSRHNGQIDWQAVKNDGIDFAIIRVGYGDDLGDQDDVRAIYNMNECERLGIPYGVYLYSYAASDEQAYSEADHMLRMIQGRNPQMGVYIDIEDTDTYYDSGINPYDAEGRECITRWAKIAMQQVANAGYTPGIYANYNYFSSILYTDELSEMKWLAYYSKNDPYADYAPPQGPWICWQYSSRGTVNGIEGNVDMNAWIY